MLAGKQPRQPILATPLQKKGTGNKAARSEVDNTVKAGAKGPTEERPSNGRCQETTQIPAGDCGTS